MAKSDKSKNPQESDDKELERLRAKRLRELLAKQQEKTGDNPGSNKDWPKEPIPLTDASFDEFVKKYTEPTPNANNTMTINTNILILGTFHCSCILDSP